MDGIFNKYKPSPDVTMIKDNGVIAEMIIQVDSGNDNLPKSNAYLKDSSKKNLVNILKINSLTSDVMNSDAINKVAEGESTEKSNCADVHPEVEDLDMKVTEEVDDDLTSDEIAFVGEVISNVHKRSIIGTSDSDKDLTTVLTSREKNLINKCDAVEKNKSVKCASKPIHKRLRDFPHIHRALATTEFSIIVYIYNLLYMKPFKDATLKDDILNFSGFSFGRNFPDYLKRFSYLKRMQLLSLKKIYTALIFNSKIISKSEMIAEILNFLFDLPKATTSGDSLKEPKSNCVGDEEDVIVLKCSSSSNESSKVLQLGSKNCGNDSVKEPKKNCVGDAEDLVILDYETTISSSSKNNVSQNFIQQLETQKHECNLTIQNPQRQIDETNLVVRNNETKIPEFIDIGELSFINSSGSALNNPGQDFVLKGPNVKMIKKNPEEHFVVNNTEVNLSEVVDSEENVKKPNQECTLAESNVNIKEENGTYLFGNIKGRIEKIFKNMKQEANLELNMPDPMMIEPNVKIRKEIRTKLLENVKVRFGKILENEKDEVLDLVIKDQLNKSIVQTKPIDDKVKPLKQEQQFPSLCASHGPMRIPYKSMPLPHTLQLPVWIPEKKSYLHSEKKSSLQRENPEKAVPVGPLPQPSLSLRGPCDLAILAHGVQKKVPLRDSSVEKAHSSIDNLSPNSLVEKKIYVKPPEKKIKLSEPLVETQLDKNHNSCKVSSDDLKTSHLISLVPKKEMPSQEKNIQNNSLLQMNIRKIMRNVSDDDDDCDEPLSALLGHPSDKVLRQQICEIVGKCDLKEISINSVIHKVFSMYPQFNLNYRKEFIKSSLRSLLYRLGEDSALGMQQQLSCYNTCAGNRINS